MSSSETKSEFAIARENFGYNRKQISEFAALIGIHNSKTAQHRESGAFPLTDAERLALAALAAGLPPWSPETHTDLVAKGKVLGWIQRAIKGEAA